MAESTASHGSQDAHKLTRVVTKTIQCQYLLYLPRGYTAAAAERWPLLLFLHGAGERGEDLELVKKHGPPKLIEQGRDLPFIVVSPQCPVGEWWSPDVLMTLLDEVCEQHRVDETRLYLTGLSMGGYGTWKLALSHPDRFAAIVPICGGGNPHLCVRLRGVPVWVFHGAKDGVVPVRESEVMVTALERAGGTPKLTVYPDAQHDSWTATYENPELYEWLLRHRREPRAAS